MYTQAKSLMRGEPSALGQSSPMTGLIRLSAAAEAARVMPLLQNTSDAPASAIKSGHDCDRDGGDHDSGDASGRVVQLITTTNASAMLASDGTPANHGANHASVSPTLEADASLPPGWQRVMHESGLPCFVNRELQVVTWTKPYALDAIGADFVTLATTHVPPLSIFSRRNVRPRQAQQLLARRRPSEDEARSKQPVATASLPSRRDTTNGQKKRKAEALDSVGSMPSVLIRRAGVSVPLVEINGKCLESPAGRSVHDFLREFATAMWRSVPQYTFSKPEGNEYNIACCVQIDGKQYPVTPGPNKPIAKEAAAEAVLQQTIPDYWLDLKKQGKVGKFPAVAQPPASSTPSTKDDPKKPSEEKEPSMTVDEFKTLTIGDPRVLQACMDLAIKTPAQVVQEYQNRHKGISVNYNTIPHDTDGHKLFKTIVTAGSTVAEGIASTKKVAKQYAAQSLLGMLHQRSATLYHEVADLYSRGSHIDLPGHMTLTVQTDPGSVRSSPSKRLRRQSPLHNHQSAGAAFGQHGSAYSRNANGHGWEGYGGGYDGGAAGWQPRVDAAAGYAKKNERIVEYYSPNSAGYGNYYGTPVEWSYAQPVAAPAPAGYGAYGAGPYPSAPTPTAYPPRPHPSGPPPGFPYGDPREQSYGRPKF